MIELNDSNFEENILSGLSLVEFNASTCPPCKEQQQVIEAIEDELQASFFVVDALKNPNLSASYNIMAAPTLIIFRDGVELERVTYPIIDEQSIKSFLEKYYG